MRYLNANLSGQFYKNGAFFKTVNHLSLLRMYIKGSSERSGHIVACKSSLKQRFYFHFKKFPKLKVKNGRSYLQKQELAKHKGRLFKITASMFFLVGGLATDARNNYSYVS